MTCWEVSALLKSTVFSDLTGLFPKVRFAGRTTEMQSEEDRTSIVITPRVQMCSLGEATYPAERNWRTDSQEGHVNASEDEMALVSPGT